MNPETTANDVGVWGSLSHIQLIVAIEKHFKIRFASKEIRRWESVGQMVEAVVLSWDRPAYWPPQVLVGAIEALTVFPNMRIAVCWMLIPYTHRGVPTEVLRVNYRFPSRQLPGNSSGTPRELPYYTLLL